MLRAIVAGLGAGLVSANEEFMAWVRGEQSMPFGPAGEHVTIRLIDFDDVEHNTFVVANQVTFSLGTRQAIRCGRLRERATACSR